MGRELVKHGRGGKKNRRSESVKKKGLTDGSVGIEESFRDTETETTVTTSNDYDLKKRDRKYKRSISCRSEGRPFGFSILSPPRDE